jgi:hypothetical protein
MRCTHLLIVMLVVGTSCAAGGHYRTDSEAFVELASRPARRPVTSFEGYSLIGAMGGRAYLSHWSGLPWFLGGGHDVYSVRIDDLPEQLAAQIRAGKDPWAR